MYDTNKMLLILYDKKYHTIPQLRSEAPRKSFVVTRGGGAATDASKLCCWLYVGPSCFEKRWLHNNSMLADDHARRSPAIVPENGGQGTDRPRVDRGE